MRRVPPYVRNIRHRRLSESFARSNHAGRGSDALFEMSYLQLLRLVSPEAIVVLTALGILAIGLMQSRRTVVTPVSAAEPRASAGGTSAATPACAIIAGLGLVLAIVVIFILPRNATVFAGMLVISPLNEIGRASCRER